MAGITSPFSAKWGKGYFENHYISNHIHAITKQKRFRLRLLLRPVSNVVLPCRTQLIELNSTLARHAVARRLKPSRATAV